MQTEPIRSTASNKFPLLSSGEVDKKALVDQYTPFVCGIARQVKKTLSPQIQFDDLVSYGMAGLLEAAERYDVKLGANFTTFSYYRVKGAIYDGLRTMGWVSRSEYRKIRFEERANTYLANKSSRQMGGTPDNSNASEQLNHLSEQVNHLVTIFVASLEATENREIEDLNTPSQDKIVFEKELRKHLKDAFQKLSAEDQTLLTLYYFQDLSLDEVGKRLGLSKSWTSRRHAQAIERLSTLLQHRLENRPEK